jgi:uncharacterized protein (TIGR02246 family)
LRRRGRHGPGHRALLGAALAASLALAGCWVEGRSGAENGDGGSGAGAETADAPGADLWSELDADLDSSAAAWNRGDLEGFLATYLPRPTTTYIGSSGLVVGFEGIRDRYAPLFQGESRRDSLAFRDLQVRPLGDSTALAIGRYALHRADSLTSTGIFTLVLRHADGDWMIVHDHSSALDPPRP